MSDPGRAWGAAAAGPPVLPGLQGNLLQGQRGRYRLRRALGRGGQAAIFDAVAEGDGRAVAVKRLDVRALTRSPEALGRFQRELTLLLPLDDPGLVRLLDHGLDPLGVPFLVVELVPGACPLDVAFLGRDLSARVALVREAARCLGALHARGVIHRDVSPGNVLVDANGRARVADLGLARGPEPELGLTRTGVALGTPGYVAPEVMLQGSREAGAAGDVWGLGVLLFQALCGQHPFPHGFLDQVERLHQGPPSPRALAPEVPPALDAVCRRALAPRPEDRYPDGASLAAALDAALAALPPPPPPGAPPAARIGRWTIAGLLGSGGMGRVFRAHDEELRRDVALKLLLPDASPRCKERFLREVAAASKVRHPAVVGVHEAGQVGGQPYLVMELVQGEPLSSLLLREPPSPRQAVRLVAELARGVAALHAAGVLHRDLKPHNVLVEDGHPRLVDFGLALLRDDPSRLSRTQEVLGTPLYMAPEQLDGQREDPRLDVYGLGALLYHLLAGRPLGESASSLQELAVAKMQPVAPGALRPDLDPALDALVLRAVAPDPARRLPSAEALALALEGWLAGAAPTPRSRPRSWLALVLVLALVLGVLVLRLEDGPPPTARLAEQRAALEASAPAGLAGLRAGPELELALQGAPADDPEARRVWAWLGLGSLARGDRPAAEAAAGRAAAGAGLAERLLLTGLACERDPEGALRELSRAEHMGFWPPELTAWRLRALLARGVRDRREADEALALVEGLRGRAPVEADELRVAALLTLGRTDEAEEALLRIPAPSPRLRWAVGLQRAEGAFAAGSLPGARRALEGLPRPEGAPTARERDLAAGALERAGPILSAAVRALRRLTTPETEEVCAALALLRALAPGAPPPPRLRDELAVHLEGSALTGQTEAFPLALDTAATWPDDPDLAYAVASCGPHADDLPLWAARLLPAARRAAEVCTGSRRLEALVLVGRTLLAAQEHAAAVAHVESARAHLGAPGRELPGLDAPAADELRGELLLIRALAERRLGRTADALASLRAARPLVVSKGAEVRAELLLTLVQMGAEGEAQELATQLARAPEQAFGPWRHITGELCWRLLRPRAPPELLSSLASALAAERLERQGGAWWLRAAWARARIDDHAGAREALREASQVPLSLRRFRIDPAGLLELAGRLAPGDEGPARELEELVDRVDAALSRESNDR